MSSLVRSLLVPMMIVVTVTVFTFDFTKGEDLRELKILCNTKANGDNSVEERNIGDLLDYLLDETPVNGFFRHLTFQGYYGIAACNGVISEDECADCLDDAENNLYQQCGFADGAQVELVDCRLRFEHSPFS